MPEYVYALHDFQPEHEDEISFRAGQPIEVVEKDDLYNDGWWQGRNLAGKVGLFPQSYTTPAAPAISTPVQPPTSSAHPIVSSLTSDTLHPLKEEQETSPTNEKDADAQSEVPPGQSGSGGNDGEVMKATMTDVQKAIEQLGRNDRDGARSFSFASTRDGDTTDRELDTDNETDRDTDIGEEGVDYHRNARHKLAEQARKVVEAAAAAEAESSTPMRAGVPPIEVEMSDESEAEEDDDAFHRRHHLHFSRDHPHIPEEEEDDEEGRKSAGVHHRVGSNETSSVILPSEDILPSNPDESGLATATVEKTSFASPKKSRSPAMNGTASPTPRRASLSPTNPNRILAPVPVVAIDAAAIPLSVSPNNAISQATPTPSVVREVHEAPTKAASPIPSAGGQPTSKHSSLASSGKMSAPLASLQTSSEATNVASSPQKKPHPSEWSVDEVVEWLTSKGFGNDVVDKFVEQEISGDVLLELDINLLKTEIGIQAFGKRMRIANAIAELRRPPSIVYSEHQTAPTHSQSQSQSLSLQSYSYSHSHTSSTQHSLNSPMYMGAMGPPGSAGLGSLMSPESPPQSGDSTMMQAVMGGSRRASDPFSSAGMSVKGAGSDENGIASSIEKAAIVGLGLGMPTAIINGQDQKHRPAQLALSPSDNALRPHVTVSPESVHDERGALSEGEAAASTGRRRRLFGRSTESGSSAKDKVDSANASKEAISPNSITASPRPKKRESFDEASLVSRHSRNKRSMDATSKGSERLSLFGGSFGGTIGKSRKPPPRYSSSLLDNAEPSTEKEKHSSISLSRLYGGRKHSGRPSTSDGLSKDASHPFKDAAKEKAKEKEKSKAKEKLKTTDKDKEAPKEKAREIATLRKSPQQEPRSTSRGPTSLKPGKSIIEQIGVPDHNGWMRKKGEHYNSWKLRYFIIKGPHLYILRSNNKAETKIKGYIHIVGYKVIADENIDPGRYGFRLVHDTDKTYYFSSEEQLVIREWMKAIMKATIGRDYSKPVVSSVNIPTIPLTVAQAMNPAPRPPSPTARDATQKALRRENPNQLSTRDARILMGLPSPEGGARTQDAQDNERGRLDSFFANAPVSTGANEIAASPPTPRAQKGAPPRPSRELRRLSTQGSEISGPVDPSLIEWANSRLPASLRITDTSGSLCDGLALLRLAESIKGKASSPPVPDSAFPSGPNDDKLDGLFRLFDFLLDHDVKMGSVSINDVRQGKRDKIIQLLKALKLWEDKRKAIDFGYGTAVQAGAFMAPVGLPWKM